MIYPRYIYAVQHNVTKKMYIGSSINPENRYKSHMSTLRAGKHTVEDMQEDFDKYGEDFSFYILEEITEHKDRVREYHWMEKYGTLKRGKGYNYKDNYARFNKNPPAIVPYKEGLPGEIIDSKERLHEIVDLLSEHEVAYTIAFLSRIFEIGNRESNNTDKPAAHTL